MTRKRFMKLLMSRGYERNTAHYYAHKTMKSGYSYQRVYNEFPSYEEVYGNITPFEMPLTK